MTETAPSVLEAVLRRDRTVVVAALVMVIGLSWLWIALGAGMEMSAVEMTRMPRDMVMTPAVVDARLCGTDVRHVVGDDGGDDASERRPRPSDLRAYQPPRAGGRATLGADRHLRRRLSRSLGRVSARRRSPCSGDWKGPDCFRQ